MTSQTPWVAFYLRHQRILEWAYWPISKSMMAWLRADSVLMEYDRRGQALAAWEPYCWEFSSVLTGLLVVWMVIQFDRRFPVQSAQTFRNVIAHVGFSVIASLVHVVGMVLIREGVYHLMGGDYDFGNWGTELWYEYRKDAVSYVNILLLVYIYRFWSSRIIEEASPISDGETSGAACERFLVRKMGKEFLLRTDSVEWVEAAGNYMNLHANGRVYPLRETMTALVGKLDPRQFARVHRSYVVNIECVESIEPSESGDGTIRLRSGDEVRLSRRYRDAFLEHVRADKASEPAR